MDLFWIVLESFFFFSFEDEKATTFEFTHPLLLPVRFVASGYDREAEKDDQRIP